MTATTRRIAALVLGAGFVLALLAPGASAHALVRSSDPANGAELPTAPPQVVITFTEPPDPKLSSVHVLDQTGKAVEKGPAQPVPGQPLQLQVDLPSLPDGVYTVNWRTVSKTDGHVTAGFFSFGVGERPTGTGGGTGGVTGGGTAQSPSVLAVAGRWAFYWSLALLLAASVVGLVSFRGRSPAGRKALAGSWLLGALGLLIMIVAERSAVGASYSQVLLSGTGEKLVFQGIGLAALGAAVAVQMIRPSRPALLVVGLTAAAVMLLHALAGHAAAPSDTAWFNVPVDWIHILAVGIWVGGLVWLIVATWGRSGQERAEPIRRFSQLALYSVIVLAATGVIRALDELGGVGSLGRLFTTGFGVTILVKIGLFVGLMVLGARNRYVNVPHVTTGKRQIGSLRRTVAAEVMLAAGVLGAAGVLSELPPAAILAQAAAGNRQVVARPLVVTGSDFATTVKVRLVVTPGTVGPNDFRASVLDYDTGKPVPATDVSLTFSMPSQPDLGTSTVDLTKQSGGVWTGKGTTIAVNGTWNVSVLVQTSTGGVEVPLTVRPNLPPETITKQEQKGQPTLYTITLAGGLQLQTYIDPGRVGNDVVHFTYFQPSGSEQPITKAAASAITPAGAPMNLKLIRFDPGHFASNVKLTPGTWTFLIEGTTPEGRTLSGYFRQPIGT